MTNQPVPTSLDALAVGRFSDNPFVDQFATRSPTQYDINFPIQKKWLNTTTNEFWELKSFSTVSGVTTANWIKIAGAAFLESLTGNSGGAVPPTANNINVVGDGVYITTVGTPGTSTLTIEPAGGLATVYQEDFGTASASLGTLQVKGGVAISTTGAGNLITINALPLAFMYVQIAAGTYVVSATDYYISCDSSGGVITVQLPNAPAKLYQLYVIKDRTASASANHITVTTVGGVVNIDGSATYTISSNYGAINLLWNGTSYEVF
jgi:hypothetical protein